MNETNTNTTITTAETGTRAEASSMQSAANSNAVASVVQPSQVATVTIAAKQSRWKSWTMWASVFGALWVIFNALGLPAKLGFSADTYNTILNAAGTILIALGIVNNPTDPAKI